MLPTYEQIAAMTSAELVALYNLHAPAPTKRFATRADGLRRLERLLAPLREAAFAEAARLAHEAKLAATAETPVLAAEAAREAKPRKRSYASALRELDHLSSREAFDALKDEFPNQKPHYPSWYRAAFKRDAKRLAGGLT